MGPRPRPALALQVLAGALKDNKRAAVAGETTFGKGLIQVGAGAGGAPSVHSVRDAGCAAALDAAERPPPGPPVQ